MRHLFTALFALAALITIQTASAQKPFDRNTGAIVSEWSVPSKDSAVTTIYMGAQKQYAEVTNDGPNSVNVYYYDKTINGITPQHIGPMETATGVGSWILVQDDLGGLECDEEVCASGTFILDPVTNKKWSLRANRSRYLLGGSGKPHKKEILSRICNEGSGTLYFEIFGRRRVALASGSCLFVKTSQILIDTFSSDAAHGSIEFFGKL